MDSVKFNIVMMKDASEFVRSVPEKARKKILYNILKVQRGEIDKELFKKLGDSDIWEFRTIFNNICYRLLAFWDKSTNSLVVATHGFIKKTQKTPPGEIERAEELKKQYFNKRR